MVIIKMVMDKGYITQKLLDKYLRKQKVLLTFIGIIFFEHG